MRTYLGPKDPFDYEVLRDNTRWSDHVARAHITAGIIAAIHPGSIIDPACGDASIVRLAHTLSPIPRVTLGDLSRQNVDNARHVLPLAGAWCEDAVTLMRKSREHHMAVLTEVLEHLEDPEELLKATREKATLLVASSPIMRPGQVDQNPEHLWMFDAVGYEALLTGAGWEVTQWTVSYFPGLEYDFGIWVCR